MQPEPGITGRPALPPELRHQNPANLTPLPPASVVVCVWCDLANISSLTRLTKTVNMENIIPFYLLNINALAKSTAA